MRTMATAGRTVLFSATTVALSMAAMMLFPMYFLKSFAYAGIATVAFTAVAAVVVTPAAIVLLGDRLDALDVRRLSGACSVGRNRSARPVEHSSGTARRSSSCAARFRSAWRSSRCWCCWARRSFGEVGLPRRPGAADARLGAPGRRPAAQRLRRRLRDRGDRGHPRRRRRDRTRIGSLRRRSVAGARRVGGFGADGTFVAGARVGPPSAPTGVARRQRVSHRREQRARCSPTAPRLSCDRLHAVRARAAAGRVTGTAQINRDSVHAITSRLPLVLGLIALITFVLLFLLTGSVVLPLKALVLNVLSLSAAFGALVWIFQDGHLGGLGTTATGTLVANMPVLLFCIAFGLSMDYEVFLVSRIREYWLASGRTRADNDESVALGVARTGRVDHRGRADHVDLVRRVDRGAGVVHADVRRRPDAGRAGGRDTGAHGARAGVHARDGPAELVGAQTVVRLHERFGISDGQAVSETASDAWAAPNFEGDNGSGKRPT